jgi:hypothetical protein
LSNQLAFANCLFLIQVHGDVSHMMFLFVLRWIRLEHEVMKMIKQKYDFMVSCSYTFLYHGWPNDWLPCIFFVG